MFSIGDYVVHPLHGAGQIEDIVEEKIAGVKKKYYVFNMPAGSLVLKIPTSSAGAVGIRNVITETEATNSWRPSRAWKSRLIPTGTSATRRI